MALPGKLSNVQISIRVRVSVQVMQVEIRVMKCNLFCVHCYSATSLLLGVKAIITIYNNSNDALQKIVYKIIFFT